MRIDTADTGLWSTATHCRCAFLPRSLLVGLLVLVGSSVFAGPVAGPELVLWLDANDLAGMDAAVGRWADKSQYGNDAVQTVPDHKPKHRVVAGARRASVVSFEASRQQYLCAGHGASLRLSRLTAFVVAKAADAPGNMWLFGKNDWGPPWTGYGIAVSRDGLHPWPHLGLGRAASHQGVSLRFSGSIGERLALVEVCCDGNRLSVSLNGGTRRGQALCGGILANDRDLLIGAGPQISPACEFLQGEIAEILLYRLALDEAQRSQVRRYLVDKYGIEPANNLVPNLVTDNGYLPITVENPSTPATRTLSPAEAESALQRDWLYQAEGKPLLQRAAEEIGWARRLAARLARAPNPPNVTEDLARLHSLEAAVKNDSCRNGASEFQATRSQDFYFAVRQVKRRIAMKNPAVDFSRVLFIDQPYPQGPEWPHQAIHRLGHRAVCGGRLLVLDGLHPGGSLRLLAPRDKSGSLWRPDLSFDARRVVFCYKAHDEKAFHLYETNLDGTGLRQLTRGEYDDLDPIYLPDGHLMFTTTRGNTYVRCGPYIYSTLLARCDADGGNVYLVSQNSEPDFVPSLMEDGRVIYSRWEYTDKSVFRVQSLWTTNPDGTNTMVFWGNQSVWPDHLAEPRNIPGSRRVMFSGVGHHDWFAGSIGIVDPDRGFNYPDGITRVTWDVPWGEVGSTPNDRPEAGDYHAAGRFTSYKTPYPLSESDLLVSARGADGKFRLYLMDVHGNRELIYEGVHHVWHAIPVKARATPPQIPDRVAWPGTGTIRTPPASGVLYSPNVYQGVAGLPRGSVRYLRVLQSDPKTYSTWDKTFRLSGPPISVVYEESVKRILSEVPVEADGSVSFEAPPGRALHFQLLDQDHRCLQTMRSFSGLMPGERRGCVGCHESHSTSPPLGSRPNAAASLALRRAPTPLSPPPWGTESIAYERFAQPALDRYCVRCHQGKAPGTAEPNLALRPAVSVFKEPYLTLVGAAGWNNPVVARRPGYGIAGAIPVETTDATKLDPRPLATLRPMTALSHASRLVQLAADGKHYGAKLDPLSLRRLMAWVDANCPFLGDEEVRRIADPDFPGIELLPIRPRVATAPVVERP